MKRKYTLLLVVLVGVFLSSCRKDDVPMLIPEPGVKVGHTFLIYMAADNNLSGNSYRNINELIEGVTPSMLLNSRIVIYQDPRSAEGETNNKLPKLWEIAVEGKSVVKKLAKEYEEQNSGSPENMTKIMNEVFQNYPAEKYGLMLWSHGTGWLPANPVYSRAFGQDVDGTWLEINELAAAIPDSKFDYIIFDACYMSTVEVAYALRQKANYIVASPAEILNYGMPYEALGGLLFNQKEANLKGLCDAFYEKYISFPDSVFRSATLSLIKTSELEELAALSREILRGKESQVYAINTNNNPHAERLQYFDRVTYHTLYDLGDFLEQPGIATAQQYERFEEIMSRAVPYYRHTKVMYYQDVYGWFHVNRYSGLASYIMRQEHTVLNQFYKTLDWYKAVY